MKPALTDHAISRYVDRVKPWLDASDARAEIEALLEVAGDPVPDLDYVEEGGFFDCFYELAPGIALGCRWERGRLVAVTTMIRTGESFSARESRRREKRIWRQRARAQKRRERLARRSGKGRRPEVLEWD